MACAATDKADYPIGPTSVSYSSRLISQENKKGGLGGRLNFYSLIPV